MTGPHDAFVQAVATGLRGPCRVERGDRLVVAVSGGADSVALLRALAVLARQRHWALDLHVGHVNHHLRPETDDEERFVQDLASELGVPFHRDDSHPGQAAENVEAAARRGRYDALREMADRTAADAIATAHHADDQLETLILRVIRGASLTGMRGMVPRRRTGAVAVIRPMLRLDHAAAMAYLQRLEQRWCEDPTNDDTGRDRARVRREVLPVLRSMRPDAAAKAVDTAQAIAEADTALRRRVRAVERRHVEIRSSGRTMWRTTARRLGKAVLGAVVRRQALAIGAPGDALGRRVIDPVVEAVRDHSGERRLFHIAKGQIEVGPDRIVWRADRS